MVEKKDEKKDENKKSSSKRTNGKKVPKKTAKKAVVNRADKREGTEQNPYKDFANIMHYLKTLPSESKKMLGLALLTDANKPSRPSRETPEPRGFNNENDSNEIEQVYNRNVNRRKEDNVGFCPACSDSSLFPFLYVLRSPNGAAHKMPGQVCKKCSTLVFPAPILKQFLDGVFDELGGHINWNITPEGE